MQLLLQLVPGYPQPQRAAMVAAKQNTEAILAYCLALPMSLCYGVGGRVAYCCLLPVSWGFPQTGESLNSLVKLALWFLHYWGGADGLYQNQGSSLRALFFSYSFLFT